MLQIFVSLIYMYYLIVLFYLFILSICMLHCWTGKLHKCELQQQQQQQHHCNWCAYNNKAI